MYLNQTREKVPFCLFLVNPPTQSKRYSYIYYHKLVKYIIEPYIDYFNLNIKAKKLLFNSSTISNIGITNATSVIPGKRKRPGKHKSFSIKGVYDMHEVGNIG